MEKDLVRKRLQNGAIAVLRADETELAEEMGRMAAGAGLSAVEVTFTVPRATKVISRLKLEYPQIPIGAGTVLSGVAVRAALDAGADFLVAPCLVEEWQPLCEDENAFFVMGVGTATEVLRGVRFGCDAVKLFPGQFYGIQWMKALREPFPSVEFIPTGGIHPNNVRDWLSGGAFAVGVGGYLTKGIHRGNLREFQVRCKKLMDALKGEENS